MRADLERRSVLTRALLLAVPLLAGRTAAAKGWLDEILEYTGIAASPGTMKGDSDAMPGGEIWIADLARETNRRVTPDGGYSWPVFMPGDTALLALLRGAAVEVPLSGAAPRTLGGIAGVRKLIGFNRQDHDRVLVLTADRDHPVQVLSIDQKSLQPLPYDDHDPSQHRLMRHLEGQERVYGDRRLYVREESKEDLEGVRTWTEVYASQGSGARRISACGGDSCGQPSLSASGELVAYIRTQR